MLVALGLALAVVAMERGLGWPDWLRAERVPVLRP